MKTVIKFHIFSLKADKYQNSSVKYKPLKEEEEKKVKGVTFSSCTSKQSYGDSPYWDRSVSSSTSSIYSKQDNKPFMEKSEESKEKTAGCFSCVKSINKKKLD